MALVLSGAPGLASALTSDRDQPVHIEADSVSLDEQRQLSIYRGNVSVRQGSLHITADTLTVHTEDGRMEKLVASGTPATYEQRPDGRDQPVKAQAGHMEYYADRDQAVLTQDAKLWQGENTFASNRIVYNLNDDKVDAGGKAGDDRVRITIQPKNEQQQE